MSRNQQLRAFRNTSDGASDPVLPFQVRQPVDMSAYGLFGYATPCSKDYASAFSFAQKVHELAVPLIALAFFDNHERSGWCIASIPGEAVVITS